MGEGLPKILVFSATHSTSPHGVFHPPLARRTVPPSGLFVHCVSERSPPDRWGWLSDESLPGQTYDRSAGPPPTLTDRLWSHAPRDAPEPDSH
jgi:hypothetical protein